VSFISPPGFPRFPLFSLRYPVLLRHFPPFSRAFYPRPFPLHGGGLVLGFTSPDQPCSLSPGDRLSSSYAFLFAPLETIELPAAPLCRMTRTLVYPTSSFPIKLLSICKGLAFKSRFVLCCPLFIGLTHHPSISHVPERWGIPPLGGSLILFFSFFSGEFSPASTRFSLRPSFLNDPFF